MTATSQKAQSTSPPVLKLIPRVAIATVVAFVLVSIVFVIADASTDNLLVTPPGGDEAQNLAFADIIVPTILGSVVGMVLAWAMARFAPRPQRTFLAVCVVGLVLYGIVPFAAAEETATAVWLNLMHVAVAVPIVGGLARWLPAGRA